MFKELTRVKQYFEKIKALETEPEKPNLTLNKEAAARFIKHGLVSGSGPHSVLVFLPNSTNQAIY